MALSVDKYFFQSEYLLICLYVCKVVDEITIQAVNTFAFNVD